MGRNARDADVDVRFGLGRLRLVLQLPRRFFQKLAIHLVADRGDVARLLGAEDVARAANFQVAHRDLEAGAEMAVFLDRLQSLGGDRRDGPIGAAAADSSTPGACTARRGREAGAVRSGRTGRRC